MSQPPQPPSPDQPPVGPASWWRDIESRSDVAPPRTAGARPPAASSAPAFAPAPPPPAGAHSAVEPAAFTPAARPPVSYGVPHQNRKPYPIIILAILLVVGVGAAGASMLSSQNRDTKSSTSSPGLTPAGPAPKAGPVPEVAVPAAPPAAVPAAPAPAPQATTPGPPLAPAPAQTASPRIVQPQPHSGKVRDEDPQRLRRAFTRYFCVHGQLPASYCRSRA